MILEMHCHTTEHSACSHISAAELVRSIHDKGFEGIILTDHHYLWMEEELEELRRRVGVPQFFVILGGQEASTSDGGHVLIYGADRAIREQVSLPAIREEFPQAAIIWAHPYRNGYNPPPERLLNPMLDGVEIFSSNHSVSELNRALRDWHQFKFTAIGGTDSHSASYAGMYPTLFDHPVKTIEDVVKELKAGRCRPFFKEIQRSGTTDTQVFELTMGAKGADNRRTKLVVKSHGDAGSWEEGARTFHIMEELAQKIFREGRYRVPRPLGKDSSSLVLIEEGIGGKSLFERLLRANPENARLYMQCAAEWLAKLHNAKLRITPPAEFLQKEPGRLEHYVSALYRIGHRHTQRIREITDNVIAMEQALYSDHPERLVQGHGDYHPRNIFIGQDNPDDKESIYVAAVDFNSFYVMPPAFDVGTFIAQFRNQFFHHRDVLKKVTEDFFLDTYLQNAENVDEDFFAQVELFRARTNLSIIYLLIKVGLGESEDLWRVMVEAEHCLANLSINEARAELRQTT